MTLVILLVLCVYVLGGIWSRGRELNHRPNCPQGFEPTMTTILFWPYKLTVVFWRKYIKGVSK